MVTTADLSVDDHLAIQSTCQLYIDASVSKTVNLPEDISFEEFQKVYMAAYESGCKGCTTYRPNADRGFVLAAPDKDDDKPLEQVQVSNLRDRPSKLSGTTYKLRWPSWSAALYVTINDDEEGRPFEIFIQSKDSRYQEWITALTVMISAHLRRGGDNSFIPEELEAMHSAYDSAWVKGKHYGSLVQYLGAVIREHFEGNPGTVDADAEDAENLGGVTVVDEQPVGEVCPACGSPTLFHEEGCSKCGSCDYTKCG